MKTTIQILKEVTVCDYCKEEIASANHRFYKPEEAGTPCAYDLHSHCMKAIVIEHFNKPTV